MKISSQNQKQSVKDFDDLIKSFLDKYGNIFFSEIDGQIFIYKPLGRKAYKDIVNNQNISDLDKEDLIKTKEFIIVPIKIQGRNFPHLVFVLSTTQPIKGLVIASTIRTTKNKVLTKINDTPTTSV